MLRQFIPTNTNVFHQLYQQTHLFKWVMRQDHFFCKDSSRWAAVAQTVETWLGDWSLAAPTDHQFLGYCRGALEQGT